MVEPCTFPVSRLVPLLRALADPEGKGEMSPEWTRAIECIERNLSTASDVYPPQPIVYQTHGSAVRSTIMALSPKLAAEAHAHALSMHPGNVEVIEPDGTTSFPAVS